MQKLLVKTQPELHPLNDPAVWLKSPQYQPPPDVDLKREQAAIDSIVGVTRNNEPIIKAIWNGDTRYWLKFYTAWNALGEPLHPNNTTLRPLVRYKALRDENGRVVSDVFPPRWLLVTRLEPEQYANTWKDESYFMAPEIGTFKQIRPDEPPKELWLWYATVAHHSNYCCATAERNNSKCYGQYAPPSYALKNLGEQKRACEAAGFKSHNPFEQVDADLIREAQDENTGYYAEIARLKVESEIYTANPLALIGVLPSQKADLSAKQAETIVKEHYDRRLQEAARYK